jgi:cytochrome c-type biogenesis protein CcmF
MALVFLVLPFGPMLTWRLGDLGAAAKRLAPAALLGAITLLASLALSSWRAIPSIGLALGVWLVAGGVIYFLSRLRQGGGRAKIFALSLAVWSLTLAHIGAGVLTIGAVAETAFRAEQALSLAPGQSVDFAGRRISLLNVGEVEGPNYTATRAQFRVEHDGDVQTLSSERRFYWTSPMATTEVGILTGLDGDLYVALGEPVRDASGSWGVRLYRNPLVQFIFGGALLMALGGLLSLGALARRRKKSR